MQSRGRRRWQRRNSKSWGNKVPLAGRVHDVTAAGVKKIVKSALSWTGIIVLALVIYRSGWFSQERSFVSLGKVVYETESDFSRIRVREKDGVRSLLFIDSGGREQKQSAIDLAVPYQLQLGYSKTMFASMLFDESHERVLIAGLGGGGMVRFLNHYFPDTQVDVVEIDPAVVEVAAEYFGTKPGPKTNIFTEDAFVYLAEQHPPYDVIYMDAFLQPPAHSGLEEKTRRLKNVEFLKSLHSQLKPDGLVAFNLIVWEHSTPGDIAAIGEAFPNVYQFGVPGTGNLIVIASMSEFRKTREELQERAAELDKLPQHPLPFADFVSAMKK